MFRLFHDMNTAIDAIDRRFLALLQANNRRALRDYAQALGISAPTCLRRLRRLEKKGVIVRHAAIVDAAQLGFAVTAFIEVSLVEASGARLVAFERRMQRCVEVLQCSEVAGDVDYLLMVATADMPSFSDFIRRYLGDDRYIRKYRSLLVLKNLKCQFELPVGQDTPLQSR